MVDTHMEEREGGDREKEIETERQRDRDRDRLRLRLRLRTFYSQQGNMILGQA
jgi:hypothetical protein